MVTAEIISYSHDVSQDALSFKNKSPSARKENNATQNNLVGCAAEDVMPALD